jgi:flagellar biosynthesis protein FlhG
MRSERIVDQAEGLRRLLAPASARIVTVLAAKPGMGATSVVINLAAALGRSGKDVLVLDEHMTHNNVANSLAMRPRFDLMHAVRGEKSVAQVMQRAPGRMNILTASRAIQALPTLDGTERERMASGLVDAADGMDAVLVDAAVQEDDRSLCACLSGNEPLVLVTTPSVSGITETYALIKRLVMQNGHQSFGIVINKVRSEQEANTVFANMSHVARRHLNVRLEFLGAIPDDESMKRATQLCKPVVEAFPGSVAAAAFEDLLCNMLVLPTAEYEDAQGGVMKLMQRLMRQATPPNAMPAIG